MAIILAGAWLMVYGLHVRWLFGAIASFLLLGILTWFRLFRRPRDLSAASGSDGAKADSGASAARSDCPIDNQHLLAILRWLPVGVVYFGLGRKVLYCNEAFARIYGYEEQELLGKVPPIPEDRRQEWLGIESNLRQGKHFYNVETVRLRKDGTLFRAYISGIPLFDDDKELTGLIGVIVESENLPKSGITYEHILSLAESSSDFLLLLDTNFRIVYANPGFTVATGIEDLHLFDTNILSYFPAEERDGIDHDLRIALLTERSDFVVRAHIQSGLDGATIPVQLEFYPVYGPDSRTPSAIACIARDLQRETELRDKLQQSVMESQTIFERAPIGIVKVNVQGYPIASNPKFQEMVGYTADELRVRPFASLVLPSDLARGRALFLDLAAGKIEHYQIAKRLVCKDGFILHTIMNVSLVRDANGHPSHTISMVTRVPGGVPVETYERPYANA